MDGAWLYWADDPRSSGSANEVFDEWSIGPQEYPLQADWPLLGASSTNGIEAVHPLGDIPTPPKNMAIYAGTRQNTYSASGPYQFTAADLKKLKPNQVLVPNDTGRESDPPVKVVSVAAFNAIDCTRFG